jgi:hypothetical protein
LQELIAPREVVFYSRHWHAIGTKSEHASALSNITGIGEDALTVNSFELYKHSRAHRMSWFSKRTTTRKEDIAYCMMGVFGINMPLLYGEGDQAFLGLQEEILKTSDDQSLFAWIMPMGRQNFIIPQFSGRLAPHPLAFQHSGNIIPCHFQTENDPYSMTNKGIRIQAPYFGFNSGSKENSSYTSGVVLGCIDQAKPSQPLGIELEATELNEEKYARVLPSKIVQVTFWSAAAASKRTVYVKESEYDTNFDSYRYPLPSVNSALDYAFVVQGGSYHSRGQHLSLSDVYPQADWNQMAGTINGQSHLAVLEFSNREREWSVSQNIVVAVGCPTGWFGDRGYCFGIWPGSTYSSLESLHHSIMNDATYFSASAKRSDHTCILRFPNSPTLLKMTVKIEDKHLMGALIHRIVLTCEDVDE